MGPGNKQTRGRFNTKEEGLVAIQLLLKAGADINAQSADGQTALHSAAQKGWNTVVRFLVEHGAALNATDGRGRTPLDFAKGNAGGGRGQAATPNKETVVLLEALMAGRTSERP